MFQSIFDRCHSKLGDNFVRSHRSFVVRDRCKMTSRIPSHVGPRGSSIFNLLAKKGPKIFFYFIFHSISSFFFCLSNSIHQTLVILQTQRQLPTKKNRPRCLGSFGVFPSSVSPFFIEQTIFFLPCYLFSSFQLTFSPFS